MAHCRSPRQRRNRGRGWRCIVGLAIVAATILAGATSSNAWQTALDGAGRARSDTWESVAFHPSGDLIVAGQSYQFDDSEIDCILVVARLSRSDGGEVWRQQRHNRRECAGTARVLVDGNGDVLIERGSAVSKHSGATGERLWSRSLGRFPYDGPSIHASAFDASGDVLFVGGFGTDQDRTKLVVAKIDGTNGEVVWRKSFTGTSTERGYNYASAVALDGAGDVVVLGTLVDLVVVDDGTYRESRGVALKLSGADGSQLWQVPADRSQEFIGTVALVIDGDGNPLHLGDGGNVVKRSGQTGAELWRYRAPAPDAYLSARDAGIALGAGGDVYATWQWFTGPSGFTGGSSVLVARIAGGDGTERWHTALGTADPLENLPAGLVVDATGNALVAVHSEATADHLDFLVVALAAADGSERWRFDVDSPGVSSEYPPGYGFFDLARAIAIDGDRVAAVGSVVPAGEFADGVAVLLSTDGAESWRYALQENDPCNEQALALAVLSSGDVVAAGRSTDVRGTSRLTVARFASADGSVAWQSDLGPGRAQSVVADAAGDVIAGGETRALDYGASSAVVVKLDGGDGSELWRLAPPRAASEYLAPVKVALAPDGDVFAAMLVLSKSGLLRLNLFRLDGADGSVRWRHTIANGRAVSLLVDRQGDVLLGTRADRSLLRAIKLDGATGAKRWITRLPLSGWDGELALTPSDDVVAAGLKRTPGSAQQVVVVLDGASGAERWRSSLGALVHGYLAVTPTGDVLASGETWRPNEVDRTVVVKLAGADGALRWRREFDVLVGGLGCAPTRLSSGGNGDALLGGCDLDNLGDSRFDVLSLAAADGALRWHRSIDGPRSPGAFGSHEYQLGEAVAGLTTDPFGNVVAVGASDGGTRGFDFTAVKWGADGSDTLVLPGM